MERAGLLISVWYKVLPLLSVYMVTDKQEDARAKSRPSVVKTLSAEIYDAHWSQAGVIGRGHRSTGSRGCVSGVAKPMAI